VKKKSSFNIFKNRRDSLNDTSPQLSGDKGPRLTPKQKSPEKQE
jgi:hypothetical protein